LANRAQTLVKKKRAQTFPVGDPADHERRCVGLGSERDMSVVGGDTEGREIAIVLVSPYVFSLDQWTKRRSCSKVASPSPLVLSPTEYFISEPFSFSHRAS
jgi:hypothetical protein